jgi:hypothetical protein
MVTYAEATSMGLRSNRLLCFRLGPTVGLAPNQRKVFSVG